MSLFSYKARRYGLEFDLTVLTSTVSLGGARNVTYKHRLWAKPVNAVAVGSPASSVLIETGSGASRTLSDWIENYAFEVIRLRYRIGNTGGNGGIGFGSVQVFEYQENSDVGTFVTSHSYASNLWVNLTGANNFGNQLINTFRSSNGGIAKCVFMHGIDQPAATRPIPSGDAGIDYYAAFMTSGASCARAIDGGRLVTGMRWNPGQDERAFKRINRPNS